MPKNVESGAIVTDNQIGEIMIQDLLCGMAAIYVADQRKRKAN